MNQNIVCGEADISGIFKGVKLSKIMTVKLETGDNVKEGLILDIMTKTTDEGH